MAARDTQLSSDAMWCPLSRALALTPGKRSTRPICGRAIEIARSSRDYASRGSRKTQQIIPKLDTTPTMHLRLHSAAPRVSYCRDWRSYDTMSLNSLIIRFCDDTATLPSSQEHTVTVFSLLVLLSVPFLRALEISVSCLLVGLLEDKRSNGLPPPICFSVLASFVLIGCDQ